MGIYIKGMEMPKSCFECPWRCKVDPENLLCRISGEYFEETFSGTIQNRHKSCPLIPVPPHGRLIDADAMIHDIEKAITPSRYIKERNADMVKFLSLEDTIIPAEEGE